MASESIVKDSTGDFTTHTYVHTYVQQRNELPDFIHNHAVQHIWVHNTYVANITAGWKSWYIVQKILSRKLLYAISQITHICPHYNCTCTYLYNMPSWPIVQTYGTNHPQLKQHTRVLCVSHSCAVHVTRVCYACHTRCILLLRLHTRANLMIDTR